MNRWIHLELYIKKIFKKKSWLFQALRLPNILQTKSKNELIWRHFEQNQAETKFILGVRYSSKRTFWGSSFWLPNTVELPLVRGDYAIGECVLGLHLLWCANFFFPGSFLIQQRSGRGTTPPSHSNINTLLNSWAATNISAPVRSRRDFKDSEKAFNS